MSRNSVVVYEKIVSLSKPLKCIKLTCKFRLFFLSMLQPLDARGGEALAIADLELIS